uniref:Uncharacterized protein n=1 Tax=Arundo donax TaxID=35708 RepID=A0A0A9HHA9_ARUDO
MKQKNNSKTNAQRGKIRNCKNDIGRYE